MVLMFWEYEYVKNHTADLDRLHRLAYLIDPNEMTDTLDRVGDALRWNGSSPTLSLTGRTLRGTYHPGWVNYSAGTITGARVVVRKQTSLLVLAHELAHHETCMKGVRSRRRRPPWHSADFVMSLDTIAAITDSKEI